MLMAIEHAVSNASTAANIITGDII